MAQAVVSKRTGRQAPTRREQQRADTRERIYLAAVAEFQRVGFGPAQIPRIAEVAGVVRGTFYFHFPSKEHVLQELALRTQGQVAEALRTLHEGGGSLQEVLERLVEVSDSVAERLGDDTLVRDLLATYVRPPLDDEAAEDTALVFDELTLHLARAMERGEIRTDIEPDRLASTVLTSLFGNMVARRTGEVDRRAELSLLVDLLLRGMTADGTPR